MFEVEHRLAISPATYNVNASQTVPRVSNSPTPVIR
jgi:hypothetical protein